MENTVYIKLLDSEYKMLKEIEEITLTDYEVGDIIKVDNLIAVIDDLKREYDDLKEEYENYKEKQTDKGFDY